MHPFRNVLRFYVNNSWETQIFKNLNQRYRPCQTSFSVQFPSSYSFPRLKYHSENNMGSVELSIRYHCSMEVHLTPLTLTQLSIQQLKKGSSTGSCSVAFSVLVPAEWPFRGKHLHNSTLWSNIVWLKTPSVFKNLFTNSYKSIFPCNTKCLCWKTRKSNVNFQSNKLKEFSRALNVKAALHT